VTWFAKLFAVIVFGMFEALPDSLQILFINGVIVEIAVYFGFGWVTTISLAMRLGAGDEPGNVLDFALLLFVGVTKVIYKIRLSKSEAW
jgi:hypothetical protein